MKILVIIPAFNEAKSIDKVIREIPQDLVDGIIVVNNNSSDETSRAASQAGETFWRLAKKRNSTKTGYYMRKFTIPTAFWGVGTAINVRRPWVLFRYAEVLLNHAEALNEAQGPVADVYGSVNQIRARAGMPSLPVGLSKDQMRERIQQERQVELCFEDHRFYDVRRWKQGEQLFNRTVSGMKITKTGTTFSYTRVPVENRIFNEKMYRFPIPQAELNRSPKNLKQNAGW